MIMARMDRGLLYDRLVQSATGGHDTGVLEALRDGAVIDDQGDYSANGNGRTALHYAASRGHYHIVKILISKGANPKLQSTYPRDDGNQAIHMAAKKGHTRIVECLVEAKADVSAKNQEGNTPLHVAVDAGHASMVEKLIQYGVNIEEPGIQDCTPLHLAVLGSHTNVVEVLLRHKANVEAQGYDGVRPVHMASARGELEILQLLRQSGCDLSAKDTYKKTCLHHAAEEGEREVVEWLLRVGGPELISKDAKNRLPQDIARAQGHRKIEQILKKPNTLQRLKGSFRRTKKSNRHSASQPDEDESYTKDVEYMDRVPMQTKREVDTHDSLSAAMNTGESLSHHEGSLKKARTEDDIHLLMERIQQMESERVELHRALKWFLSNVRMDSSDEGQVFSKMRIEVADADVQKNHSKEREAVLTDTIAKYDETIRIQESHLRDLENKLKQQQEKMIEYQERWKGKEASYIEINTTKDKHIGELENEIRDLEMKLKQNYETARQYQELLKSKEASYMGTDANKDQHIKGLEHEIKNLEEKLKQNHENAVQYQDNQQKRITEVMEEDKVSKEKIASLENDNARLLELLKQTNESALQVQPDESQLRELLDRDAALTKENYELKLKYNTMAVSLDDMQKKITTSQIEFKKKEDRYVMEEHSYKDCINSLTAKLEQATKLFQEAEKRAVICKNEEEGKIRELLREDEKNAKTIAELGVHITQLSQQLKEATMGDSQEEALRELIQENGVLRESNDILIQKLKEKETKDPELREREIKELKKREEDSRQTAATLKIEVKQWQQKYRESESSVQYLQRNQEDLSQKLRESKEDFRISKEQQQIKVKLVQQQHDAALSTALTTLKDEKALQAQAIRKLNDDLKTYQEKMSSFDKKEVAINKQLMNLKTENGLLDSKLKHQMDQVEQLYGQKREWNQEKAALEHTIAGLRKDLHSHVQKLKSSENAASASHEREQLIQQLLTQDSTKDQTISQLRSENSRISKEAAESTRQLRTLQEKEQNMDEINSIMETRKLIISRLEEENQKLNEQLTRRNEHERRYQNQVAQINHFEAEKKIWEATRNALTEKFSREQENSKIKEDRINQLETQVRHLEVEKKALEEKKATLIATHATALDNARKSQEKNAEDKLTKLKEQDDFNKRKIVSLTDEIGSLKHNLEDTKAKAQKCQSQLETQVRHLEAEKKTWEEKKATIIATHATALDNARKSQEKNGENKLTKLKEQDELNKQKIASLTDEVGILKHDLKDTKEKALRYQKSSEERMSILQDQLKEEKCKRSNEKFEHESVVASLTAQLDKMPAINFKDSPEAAKGNAPRPGHKERSRSLDRVPRRNLPPPPSPPKQHKPFPLTKPKENHIIPMIAPRHEGLHNLGNTCYMNAVLQCLFSVDRLKRYFLNIPERMQQFNTSSPQKGDVARVFSELLRAVNDSPHRIRPVLTHFKEVAGKYDRQFQNTRQQEAHDFLSVLLSWLHQDLQNLQKHNGHASSIISDVFFGFKKSQFICRKMQVAIAENQESFSNLTLAVNGSKAVKLEDLLKHHFREQSLDWECRACQTTHECGHKTYLETLPPVLIFHFSRYNESMRPSFFKTPVEFPAAHLNLDALMVPGTITGKGKRYELFAVCCHHGQRNFGHYTAYCRSLQDKAWYTYDDTRVRKIDIKKVLKEEDAHILFYKSD